MWTLKSGPVRIWGVVEPGDPLATGLYELNGLRKGDELLIYSLGTAISTLSLPLLTLPFPGEAGSNSSCLVS